MSKQLQKRIHNLESELKDVKKENSANKFAILQYPNSGLYGKYNVLKCDGSQTDPKAEYLVLRIDSHQSDPSHKRACRNGSLTFAFSTCNPDLARDVVLWNQKWDEHDKEQGVEDVEDKRLPFSVDDLVEFYEGFYLPKVKEIEADAENGLFQKTSSDELNGLAMESAFKDWEQAMLCVIMGDPNSENPES